MAAKKAPPKKKETMGPPAPPVKKHKPSADARAFGAATSIFVPPELQHEAGPTKRVPKKKESVVVRVPKRTESLSEKKARLARETHARERLRIGKHISSPTGANRLDAVPERKSAFTSILGGHGRMWTPAHDLAVNLGLAGKAAAIKGAKGIESWAQEVADIPMDVLTAMQGGGAGPRTALPIPSSAYKASQVLGEAEPLARPVKETAKFIGSERGQEEIWGKSLVNLALHGDTPGTKGEAAGLSLGIIGIMPFGKLTQLARFGKAARAAGKIGAALPDTPERTAWRAAMAQRVGEEQADSLLALTDNAARNLHPDNPNLLYEQARMDAPSHAGFTPTGTAIRFQTEAGPRTGLVKGGPLDELGLQQPLNKKAAFKAVNRDAHLITFTNSEGMNSFILRDGDEFQYGYTHADGETEHELLTMEEARKEIYEGKDHSIFHDVPAPDQAEVPVFRSDLIDEVEKLPDAGLTRENTEGKLRNAVKPAEWENSGMQAFVEQYPPGTKIPKADIQQHLASSLNAYDLDEIIQASNSSQYPTRYGSSSYYSGRLTVREETDAEPYFEIVMKLRTPLHQRAKRSVMKSFEPASYDGKGMSHWQQPDVVGHVRFHIITDADGKKALVVDEIQSDWASEWRGAKGQWVSGSGRLEDVQKEMSSITSSMYSLEDSGMDNGDEYLHLEERLDDLYKEKEHLEKISSLPGPPPLGQKQMEAIVRRTMRYAHDAKVDRIIIVRGDVQAVRNTAFHTTPKGRPINLHDDTLPLNEQYKQSEIWGEDTKGLTQAEVKAWANDEAHAETPMVKTFRRLYGHGSKKGEIPEIFEKEMGEKGVIREGIFEGGFSDQTGAIRRTQDPTLQYKGVQYAPDINAQAKVGDIVNTEEGMGQLVKVTQKKQGGSRRTGTVVLEDGRREMFDPYDELTVMKPDEGRAAGTMMMDAFVIEMTDGAKAKAAAPMAYYQQRAWQAIPKGATEFFADGTRAIHLFEDADISTIIHELSHVVLPDLNDVDKAILSRHFGGFKTTADHEAYARALERYVYEGMAATSELDSVFAKIKAWMGQVYLHVNNIGAHVHPEVKQVFDRMLVKNETPEQQLVRMLKEAPPVRRAQEAGYSEERGRRIADMFEQWDREGGKDAFHTALASLKGELPKEEFTALDDLTPEALDHIVNAIRNSNKVRPYQKVRAAAAVVKATEGAVPTKSELELLSRIFGKEVGFKKVRKNGIDQILVEIINIPRSLSASIDLSAPLRQGLVAGARHPIIFKRNFMPMVKALRVKNYEDQTEMIVNRPNFERYQRAKLAVETNASDPAFANREEAFYSSYADKIPGVKHSSNAYSSFLHNMRADVFDHMIATAQAKNIKRVAKGKKAIDVDSADFLEGLGMYVNTITGRGALPNTELLPIEKMAPGLNTLFFSPRLLASRINMISPFYYGKLWRKDPFVAKQAMRAMLHTVTGAVATLVIADQIPGLDVGTNPTSANFGKVRIGDTRIDLLAGFNPLMVFIARETLGYSTSSTSGKRQDLKGGFGESSRKDILYRFGESKLAPSAGILRDVLGGQTFIGDDVTLQSEALNFIPMMWRDAWEVGNESNDPTTGAVSAAAVVVLGGLGIGFSSYPDKAAKSSGGSSGESPTWDSGGGGDVPTWDSGGASEGPVWTP